MRAFALVVVVACGGKQPSAPTPAPAPARDAGVDAAVPDAALAADEPNGLDDGPLDEHDHEHGELECVDIIRELASYPPVLAADAPERDWQLEIRGHLLDDDCQHLWSEQNRECIATQGPAACVPQMPGDLAIRLAKLSELAGKIADAKKKPATIECKQAVGAHYADIRWKHRLDGYSAKVRNQMIADSRKLMLAACRTDQWSASARACLSLGGGDLCFFRTPIRRMWGYPADGSVRATGVADCDDYDAAVNRLATCTKLEAHVRESLVRTNAALKAQIAASPPAERAQRGPGCRAALKPISDMIHTFGC